MAAPDGAARRQGRTSWSSARASSQDRDDRDARRRRGLADEGHRRDREARHRSALPARPRDLREHRLPLRHPEQAPARAELPEQRRAIRLVDERNSKEDDFAVAGGVKGFVEFINTGKKVLHPNVFHAMGEKASDQDTDDRRRSGDAVERRLQREGPLLHQQHPAARRRHPPDRPARGDDARHQQVHRGQRAGQEGQGRGHRRRHARRPVPACCQVKVPEPKFSSQTKDKLVSSEVRGPVEDVVSKPADRLPAGEPERRQDHLRQDRRRRARARSGAQGARDDAPQGRARRHGPARQAGRLPGEGPGAVRDLHRRGRLRRRLRQAGPRPQVPGDPAAARQDPERREGALREAADQQRDPDADHRAGHRHRQGHGRRRLQRRQAALPPHHHHDRRRRRRRPHPHAAADLLLPPDARAGRARPHLHRAAAALQGQVRQGRAVPEGRPRARRLPAEGRAEGRAARDRRRPRRPAAAGAAGRDARGAGAQVPAGQERGRAARATGWTSKRCARSPTAWRSTSTRSRRPSARRAALQAALRDAEVAGRVRRAHRQAHPAHQPPAPRQRQEQRDHAGLRPRRRLRGAGTAGQHLPRPARRRRRGQARRRRARRRKRRSATSARRWPG